MSQPNVGRHYNPQNGQTASSNNILTSTSMLSGGGNAIVSSGLRSNSTAQATATSSVHNQRAAMFASTMNLSCK